MEAAIATLLPSAGLPGDRRLLLDNLLSYSRVAVSEARRLGPVVLTKKESVQALEWLERPVFICGHHRSGTTLMQQLLDSHPELLVLPSEGTYFTSFAYAARANTSSGDVDRFVEDWIARLVDPNYEPHFKLGCSGPAGCPATLFAQRILGWYSALRRARPALARFA